MTRKTYNAEDKIKFYLHNKKVVFTLNCKVVLTQKKNFT